MSKIKRNMVRCKLCGDVIESTYRHDYVTCKCGNVSVDGGHEYLRRNFNPENGAYEDTVEDLSEIEGDNDA